MSFCRLALRLAGLHALRGQTLVGENVRDSDIGAIDISGDGALRTDQDRPFIVVYTDDSTAEEADLRDLRQNGHVDFVCEFGIASAMTDTDPDTGESRIVGVNIPATDAAFEATLDFIAGEIITALTGPGPWAELWRRLSRRVVRMDRRRAATAEDGVRIAAHQLRIRLDALADPVRGQPLAPGAVWTDFLTALEAEDHELAAVAAGFLGPQGSEVTVETIRRSRGHTAGEAAALGYGPLHEGGEDWTIQTPVIETDG